MVQQASIMHAQVAANSAANLGNRDSSAAICAGRASSNNNHSVAASNGLTNHDYLHNKHHLGIVGTPLQQRHHHLTNIGSNKIQNNGINAGNTSNILSNHHHLGQGSNNNGRNRLANSFNTASSIVSAAAAAMALNSHFSHHPFNTITNGNATTNSNSHAHQHHHHHHPMSLASSSHSSSSASSITSSPPSASVSPSSLAPGTPPQAGNSLGSNPTSSLLANNGHHHHQSNITQHHQHATNYSHLSSTQNNNNNNLQQQQQQQQNTSRYKTELCRPFEENGTCKYGEKCQFAHGMSELRTLTRHPKYKTEFCRTFHTTGFCPYGPRCHFIHNSKKPPTANQQSTPMGAYSNGLPFGHQTSHSASPSTSPISSTSSNAATSNGSSSFISSLASSASPTSSSSSSSLSSSSSSSSSSQRMLDAMTGFQYGGRPNSGLFSGQIDSSSHTPKELDHTNLSRQVKSLATAAASQRRNENEEANLKGQATGCAKETQRLLWIHSQMNESSRWPPAMCASGLISSNANSRRTWQMEA